MHASTIPHPVSAVTSTDPGLRERKKRRTRATLIDAAVELCVQQGYDNTTVEQIAAAADVSPRTFSRYFPTKDAVILAVVDEVAEYVADALARQPYDITEHDALVRAHVETFMPADPTAPETMSFNRMALLLQIVNSSPTLVLSTFSFRPGAAPDSAVVMMAGRMGVPVDHPAVRILFDTWAVLMAAACADLGTSGSAPIEPGIVCERIQSTYAVFARLWSPWRPPAGASRR